MVFVTKGMTYQMDMRQLSANALLISVHNVIHVISCKGIFWIKYTFTGECKFIMSCDCYK